MKGHVTKVAVLGSGVMGGTIAAHFANAGIPALVLDIVPDAPPPDGGHAAVGPGDRTVRNRLAEAALARLSGMRPAALFTASRRRLLEAGNLEDDLGRLAEADWVIEVVREEMAIKKKLLAAVVPHLRADALLTSNTSGLSLTEMAESLPTSVRPRFAGTHFFNPPRYMRLLELIPTRFTSSDVVAALAEIASVRLGKGVVLAKDTPNFIANRIGIHSLMATIRVMQESGMTIEQVDALTGKAMARPKTATFRLADLVGVDVLALVADNVRRRTNDESNELFAVPDFLRRMIERGLLGDKSGGGFYKKVGGPDKKILALDLDTLEYRPTVKPAFPELAAALAAGRLDQRLQELVRGPGEAARVAWRIVAPTLVYAASRLGEIADDAETIDRAMRLGYNWALGPFEVWDALGFRATAERLERDGYVTPDWVRALVVSGAESLNRVDGNRVSTPTFEPGRSAPVDRDPRAVSVELLRRAGGELRRNPSASLLDAGDGVLLLEFHSKMNAIDEHTIEMISTAAEEAERNWIALVVANDGESFCAGANLLMLAGLAEAGDWESIERIVRSFQAANDRLERCAVPVVVAPHGIALGGGCEVVLAGHAIRAAAETYLGLVEVGAGLVPAGGGCMRLYRNLLDRTSDRDPYPALETAFRTIGMAKVAGSAEEARELGFLRDGDGSSMNPEHRIAQARVAARALADTGHAPPQARPIPVMGRQGIAWIESALVNMAEGRFISEHDRTIGRELARILSGGDVSGPLAVAEDHLLDLEVESFLRLCGEPKTHRRIEALLKTGKPLRN